MLLKPDILTIEILSDKPIGDDDICKIKDIFKNSKCPFESLKNTFENVNFDGKTLMLNDGDDYSVIVTI